jgi:hypothetical protein
LSYVKRGLEHVITPGFDVAKSPLYAGFTADGASCAG